MYNHLLNSIDIKHVKDHNVKVVVDATKKLLLNVLKYNPFLIKPNNHELEEIFNVESEEVSYKSSYYESMKKVIKILVLKMQKNI